MLLKSCHNRLRSCLSIQSSQSTEKAEQKQCYQGQTDWVSSHCLGWVTWCLPGAHWGQNHKFQQKLRFVWEGTSHTVCWEPTSVCQESPWAANQLRDTDEPSEEFQKKTGKFMCNTKYSWLVSHFFWQCSVWCLFVYIASKKWRKHESIRGVQGEAHLSLSNYAGQWLLQIKY